LTTDVLAVEVEPKQIQEMDPEVKHRWVEALRSGRYEQGTGALNKEGKLCCLGVLCEVALEDGLPMEVGQHKDGVGHLVVEYDEVSSVLPDLVQEYAGLSDDNPSVLIGGSTISLAELNDDGTSFNVIADVIEEQL
jgi:hypothetical protein